MMWEAVAGWQAVTGTLRMEDQNNNYREGVRGREGERLHPHKERIDKASQGAGWSGGNVDL